MPSARLSWLNLLAAEIAMSPRFLAAMDEQLRDQARRLIGGGVDFADGRYALMPPDDGFTIQFRTIAIAGVTSVMGTIDGFLLDPTSFGHPVVFGWRSRTAPDQPIQPNRAFEDEERDLDLEFFWLEFPTADLSADTRVNTRVAAGGVTARFPVEWDVHHWEGGVSLTLHADRAFTAADVIALHTAIQAAAQAWNARERGREIDYLAEPDLAPDRATVRWYVDQGVGEADVLVAAINAVGAMPAAAAIVRCSVRS